MTSLVGSWVLSQSTDHVVMIDVEDSGATVV